MAERLKAAVSKTVVPVSGTVGSNPTLSATSMQWDGRGGVGNGEVLEWPNRHDWKSCRGPAPRGFESRPLRHLSWFQAFPYGL